MKTRLKPIRPIIFFLDFDGVVNKATATSYVDGWLKSSDCVWCSKAIRIGWSPEPAKLPLSKIKVNFLNELNRLYPDSVWVFSTAWRHSFGVDGCVQALKEAGLTETLYFVGTTPTWSVMALRGDEILQFIQCLHTGGFSDFVPVILDDNPHPLEIFPDNFVHTKNTSGLLKTDFAKIKRIAKFGLTVNEIKERNRP